MQGDAYRHPNYIGNFTGLNQEGSDEWETTSCFVCFWMVVVGPRAYFCNLKNEGVDSYSHTCIKEGVGVAGDGVKDNLTMENTGAQSPAPFWGS